MPTWLSFVFAIVCFLASGCSRSDYVRKEIGDEVALVSKRQRSLDILPDVVFYEHKHGVTYGVRRLDYVKVTAGGFWAKCFLFEGSKAGLRYYGTRSATVPTSFGSMAAIKFAKGNCLNFGAPRQRNRRGNFIDDYLNPDTD